MGHKGFVFLKSSSNRPLKQLYELFTRAWRRKSCALRFTKLNMMFKYYEIALSILKEQQKVRIPL
jgi:hypothetical protein